MREGPPTSRSFCDQTPPASSGLLSLEGDGTPQIEDISDCRGGGGSEIFRWPPAPPLVGRALGLRGADGPWSYTAYRESSTLNFQIPTSSVLEVGAAPTGLAQSPDNHTAFVHSPLDHRIDVLKRTSSGGIGVSQQLGIGTDTLAPDVSAGRRLFYSGTDTRISSATLDVACSTCHPDGREDGHTWWTSKGLRRTPLLAGRLIAQGPPYRLDGSAATFADLIASHLAEFGGSGLDAPSIANLFAYIASLPLPQNPKRGSTDPAVVRGQALFHTAACDSCHVPPTFTSPGLFDVGTTTAEDVLPNGLRVPSLLGVARTDPYLHDGSAPTLADVITRNASANRHGLTSNLTASDVNDVVAYLQSL